MSRFLYNPLHMDAHVGNPADALVAPGGYGPIHQLFFNVRL
jgi:hypothetical protein